MKPRRFGLARAISKLGYSSRSHASDLIRAGRVRLNGKIRHDPETPVYLETDRIEIDKELISQTTKVYLVLNKPRGVVTTASDERGRRTIYEFVSEDLTWVAPVGRLDKASEGLLLLTNDSGWAARVLAPATHLEKTYHVQIATVANEKLVATLLTGVKDQGNLLRANRVEILRLGQRNSWLEIVLDEGKNRQIRRMLAQLGIAVLRLVRVSIGSLELGKLAKGKVRHLTTEEKKNLDREMSGCSKKVSNG
jgi:23S rRNA pseudouridine2605 synthase